MSVKLIIPAENIVGESAVWDDEHNRLLWVDIIKKTIHSYDPNTRRQQQWGTPDFVTSIGLKKNGGAIVGLTKTLCFWNYDDNFDDFIQIEKELPGNRLNEGVVGPDGAFWVGTMQNNIAPDGSPKDIKENTGRLYRCLPDGSVENLSDDLFGITNTLAWTNDGKLITADTLQNEIYSYTIDPEQNVLRDRKVILHDFEPGLPDGSAIDCEGYIWNCRVVGGSCVVRLSPQGVIDKVIDLPCSWPTSCTFGGENLDTLYVTSARFTMGDDYLANNPQEGGLFAVHPNVRGIKCNRFG